jgi:glycosyltransferase involved in cell wall biosynthesis
MLATLPKFLLVTPVWNDSVRLERFGVRLAKALAASGLNLTWVIADDGSDIEEVEQLQRLKKKFSQIYLDVVLHLHPERSFKGGAIYQSWQQFPEADFYAFVDADGAVSADELIRMLNCAGDSENPDTSFVAVRQFSGPLAVERSLLRKATFHLFRTLVRGIVGLKWMDTQCGAKVISGRSYRAVSERLFEVGFVFDVELLATLQQDAWPVAELPIMWQEISGSKLNLWRDLWTMTRGLMRIRRRLNTSAL